MSIKLICSDCNGVLNNVDKDYSKSGFYASLGKTNFDLYKKISDLMFTGKARHLARSWMAGEITYKEVNKILSARFNYDYNLLNEILEESARELKLNWELIEIYQKHRKNNIKVIITSDNMDIFSEQTVPHNKLNSYFDEIHNSSNLKHLKEENEFELYKNLARKYNFELNQVLIVDDGENLIENADKIGFSTYLYNQDTYKNFEKWLENNII